MSGAVTKKRGPNRRSQSCNDCRRPVYPGEGTLFIHDKQNPPPPGAIGSWGKKHKQFWLVRCGGCTERYDTRRRLEYLEEIGLLEPWWAA